MGRHIIVTSFGEDIIAAVRAAAPDLHTAIIDNPRYRQPSSVLQFGRTYVVNAWSVTAARTATWRRAGISVRPWTVDSEKGWSRMAYDKAGAGHHQPSGRLPGLGPPPLPLTRTPAAGPPAAAK